MKHIFYLVFLSTLLLSCSNFQIYSDKQYRAVCKKDYNGDIIYPCKLKPVENQLCRDFKGNPFPEFCALPGVPFYVKKNIYVQKTTYDVLYVEANFSIKITEIDGASIAKPKVQSFTIPLSFNGLNPQKTLAQYNKTATVDAPIRETGEKLTPTEMLEIESIWLEKLSDEVKKKIEPCLPENRTTLCQISIDEIAKAKNNAPFITYISSNIIERETVVDYKNKYYYNVNVPLFSTSEASITLNEDGTLTTASSNIDTTEQATALPVNDLFTKFLNLSSNTTSSSEGLNENDEEDASEENKAGELQNRTLMLKVEYALNFTPAGMKYIFSKQLSSDYELSPALIQSLPPIEFNLEEGSFERTSIKQTEIKTENKDETDKSKYKFELSGGVTPPSEN